MRGAERVWANCHCFSIWGRGASSSLKMNHLGTVGLFDWLVTMLGSICFRGGRDMPRALPWESSTDVGSLQGTVRHKQ